MMDWDELVKLQDFHEEQAREEMGAEGRVLQKVVFVSERSPERMLEDSGMGVVSMPAQIKGEREPEAIVVLLLDASPEGIAGLWQAASNDPERMSLMWAAGEMCGWSRAKTAEKVCDIMRKEFQARENMDLLWAGVKALGAKIDAYASIHISETYVCGADERHKGQQVKDVPGRREGLMINLETRQRQRSVAIELKREVPADESSKFIGFGERVILDGLTGRATCLVRRAS